MILNDGVYFLVWILFFDRFKNIGGWQLTDMFLVYGVSAEPSGWPAYSLVMPLIWATSLSMAVWIITCPCRARSCCMCWPAGPSRAALEIFYTVSSVIAHPASDPGGLVRFISGSIPGNGSLCLLPGYRPEPGLPAGTTGAFTDIAINAMITFAIYPSRSSTIPPN